MSNIKKIEPHNEIRATAAKWLLRHQEGELDSDEQARWQSWRSECEAHDIAYRELDLTWQELDLIEDISLPVERDKDRTSFGLRMLHFRGAIAAGLGAVVCGVLLMIYFNTQSGFEQPNLQVYETGTAEHQLVTLGDGSEIELGAQSVVVVNYTHDMRAIDLTHGEAFFSVVKDTSRPFVVNIGFGEVRSIGTEFNIHRLDSQVVVTVVEGAVGVTDATGVRPATVVAARQEVSVSQDGQVGQVSDANTNQAVSWRNQILNFVDQPLVDAINDVNRYSDKQIIIMDRSKMALRISATYFVGQTDDWLNALAQVYSLRIVPAEEEKILIM